MKNNTFYVIGNGRHFNKRILPVFKKNKIFFKFINSRLGSESFLNEILNIKNNTNDIDKTFFLITSPPKTHNDYIFFLLAHNMNILVEKPAFTHYKDFMKSYNKLISFKKIFYEMFMYKITNQYKRVLNFYLNNFKYLKIINLNFQFPSISESTFRNKNLNIENSIIYDVGCYPISLLTDIDIKLNDIKILKLIKNKKIIKFISLEGTYNNIKIYINFGYHRNYMNSIEFLLKNKNVYIFNDIFNGYHKIKKSIFLEKTIRIKHTKDINAFEKMFTSSYFLNIRKNHKKNILNTKFNLNTLQMISNLVSLRN